MEHQAGSSSVDVVLPPVPGEDVSPIPGVDEGLIVLSIPGEGGGRISSPASPDSTTVEGSLNVVDELGSILLLLEEVEASESGTSAFGTSVFAEGLTAMIERAGVAFVVVQTSLLSV